MSRAEQREELENPAIHKKKSSDKHDKVRASDILNDLMAKSLHKDMIESNDPGCRDVNESKDITKSNNDGDKIHSANKFKLSS